MMKLTGAISTGLAVLFVVPAVADDGYQASSLRESLARTERALEKLAGIESDLKAGKREAVARILQWSEAPSADPRELDRVLVERREEVGQLRERIDQIENRTSESDLPPAKPVSKPIDPNVPVTGLDPLTLRSLGSIPLPAVKPPAPAVPEGDKVTPDPPNYSANALGEVQAAYRAKRYDEGLALVREPGADPDAWYWRGRLLEKLERHQEAVDAYRKVIELRPESPEAQRAAENLKFLEWRMDFLRRVDGGTEEGTPR
jgi:tetratricopeptide (TPR) repeat protein